MIWWASPKLTSRSESPSDSNSGSSTSSWKGLRHEMCECSCISWTYLDYAPKFSNNEALIRNFRWYLENLGKFENASGVSHRVPWKQGAVGALKRFF